VFALGGNDGRRDLATVESFDSASGSWRSEAPMPSKRRALTACVLDGRLFALGGCRPPPFNQPANRSINQSINQPTNQSINQPINQSTNQSIIP